MTNIIRCAADLTDEEVGTVNKAIALQTNVPLDVIIGSHCGRVTNIANLAAFQQEFATRVAALQASE